MSPSLALASKDVYRACDVIWACAAAAQENYPANASGRWLDTADKFHAFYLATPMGRDDASALLRWLYDSALAMGAAASCAYRMRKETGL